MENFRIIELKTNIKDRTIFVIQEKFKSFFGFGKEAYRDLQIPMADLEQSKISSIKKNVPRFRTLEDSKEHLLLYQKSLRFTPEKYKAIKIYSTIVRLGRFDYSLYYYCKINLGNGDASVFNPIYNFYSEINEVKEQIDNHINQFLGKENKIKNIHSVNNDE